MNWLGIGIVGAAAAATYVLAGKIRWQNRLLTSGIRTVGTVAGHEEEDTQDAGLRHRLLVQFTARNGRRYTGRSSWRAGQPQQSVGDLLAIVYETSNPYGLLLEAELSPAKNYLLLVLTWAGAAYFLWNS